MTSPKIAILMAAGTGVRLRPITESIPKPLVNVNKTPIIETILDGLEKAGMEKIYIVTGYLAEQFEYLPVKYPNITLIHNSEYAVKNNISSIYAVRDIMGTENCFICEADLLVMDNNIFKASMAHSQYMAKFIKGDSDDWSFRMDGERMVKITIGGTGVYNMVGISYWTKEDAQRIADATVRLYQTSGHEQLYWDEVVDSELLNMYVCVQEVSDTQIVEIDTLEELRALDSRY